MTPTIDELLPNATDLQKKIAAVEAEKASLEVRRQAAQEAAKKDLVDQLSKPSGLSDEEAIRRATVIIQGAVSRGDTEVQVYRFPNRLCTDGGRAINQQEQGWEKTLTGIPREIYALWDRQFRPRGYRLRAHIIDFPGGMPGDVGMTLIWG